LNAAVEIARRPLVLALLLANAAYFLWTTAASPPDGVVPWRRPGAIDARPAPPTPGVESIVLAGEAGQERREVLQRNSDESAVEEARRACFAIGPFNSLAASAAAAAFLRARQYSPELRYAADAVPEQTAVVIDDLPTRADQQRVIRRLVDAGLRDVAALEPRKPDAAGLTAVYPISLGVFKAAAGAESRADAARKLGLAPTLVPRQAVDAEHWLRVRAGANLSATDVRRIAGGRGWRITDCETE
jgi:hypothetical protein